MCNEQKKTIVANYEDAITFANRFSSENFDKSIKEKDSPSKLLLGLFVNAEVVNCLKETIAFIYGKTKEEVADDIIKATEEPKGRSL